MMWGRKFEQYVLADTVDGTPDADRPVNENEELCVVYGSRVNTHSLLYGAEMDGVDSREELRSYQDLRRARFVELKTHRMIQKRAHESSFKKYKLRSVWCQAAPVAIDCVLFGHRSDDGIVKVLNRFNIDEILDESAEWQAWESDKCLDFMNKFLEEVKKSAKQHLPENSPDSVIKFEWQLGQARVRADVIVGPSEYSFLPKWFTDNFQHSVQVVKQT
ncbi:decapping and exoribonuclease protein isoform X2 [Bacillus rossius redtenbacheri]